MDTPHKIGEADRLERPPVDLDYEAVRVLLEESGLDLFDQIGFLHLEVFPFLPRGTLHVVEDLVDEVVLVITTSDLES